MADPITDENELRQFLTVPESQVPTVQTPGPSLLPRAKAVLDGLSDEKFIQQEQRPGIPLQINPAEGELSTISPWTRFQTARRQTLEDQQKYLESIPAFKNVRKAKNTDDFIVEIQDPDTGKPKDVLLNEREMTLGDLGALAADAPEIATSLIAASLGGPIGSAARGPKLAQLIMKAFGTAPGRIALGAAGYKAGQASEEIGTEIEQGQNPDVAGIFAKRAKEIPGEAALLGGTASVLEGANLASRLIRGGPGMFKTAAEREAAPAAGRLTRKYGGTYSYSAGQASGMPLLDYLEAYASAKPQATAQMEAFKALQSQENQALMRAMTTKAGSDEEAGQALLRELEPIRVQKQQALDAIRQTMTQQESAALDRQLGRSAQFNPSEQGGQFRQAYQAQFQGVKNDVRQAYTNAYSIPGALDPDVPVTPIVHAIDRLQGQFPTMEGQAWLRRLRDELEPTDPVTGLPILRQEAYRDIVQRRSDLWNRIQTAPADRSTKDYVFGQLSNAYTSVLDDAAKNIKNVPFATAIRAANQDYITKELPFYQSGVSDILLKAGERGAPENIELMDRFIADTDLYRRLTSVIGANAPAMAHVRSSIIDGLIGKSGTSAIAPQFIDAETFINNLREMATNRKSREMFQDVFGANGQAILDQARVLGGIQGVLPKEEVEALLTGPVSGAGAARARRGLVQVVRAQNQLDRVEAKRLLGAPTEFVNPEELANRYWQHLTESELQVLTTRLEQQAPAAFDQLRDKMTEQILGKAGAASNITKDKLEKVLLDPKNAPKYRLVLGDERFSDLEDFAKAMGSRDRSREIAKATGLLIKGESIGEIASAFKPGRIGKMVAGAAGLVPGWLGWKYAAKMLNAGWFRDWAAKDFPPAWGQSVTAALVSEPVMQDLMIDLANSSSSPGILTSVAQRYRQHAQRVSQPAEPQQQRPAIQDIEELKKFLQGGEQ